MKTRRLTAILTLACLSAMLALSVAPIWSASAQTAEKTVAENAPPKADPVMTEELMARLIKRTLASKKDFAIPAATCSVFNLCEAGHDLPAKQVSMIVPEGKHVIMVPLKEDSKDVVIAFGYAKSAEIYLTDGSGKLRAAAIGDPTGVRLITNEAATEKFKAELALLAKEAEYLPPTDGPGRGNK